MKNTIASLFIAMLAFFSQTVSAQKSGRDTTKVVIPELRHNFNASGSRYIKGTFLAQTWVRYSDLNPGSTIEGFARSSYADIGLRRWRIQAYGQITDRLFFYMQFGQNNFSFLQRRFTGAFLHDAVTEYRVASWLQIGGGLTGWSGMSRYSSPGVGSILGIDAPLYQQATNGVNDQFVRKLSVYAKGQVGRLDYRAAVSSPMSAVNSTVVIPGISQNSSFSIEPPKMQTSGYLQWMFFDKENNTTPYLAGTYLGRKKILNIGAGWVSQNDAMWRTEGNGDTTRTAMTLLGVDVFLDMPVNDKGAAVTAYVACNDFDFGRNYVRMNGAMNPANGTVASQASLNGAGVNYPMIGTGSTLFAQLGYKFRDRLLPDEGTLQPYASLQYSRFDLLKDAVAVYEAGINWLIHGTHTGKISAGMQSRPVFSALTGGNVETTRRNMYVLQYQISF
jgi:hypothetical protein